MGFKRVCLNIVINSTQRVVMLSRLNLPEVKWHDLHSTPDEILSEFIQGKFKIGAWVMHTQVKWTPNACLSIYVHGKVAIREGLGLISIDKIIEPISLLAGPDR